jgi:hypothetical protein
MPLKKISSFLEENNIFDGICSKSVSELRRRVTDEEFAFYQKRRAQTEGRVGRAQIKKLECCSTGKSKKQLSGKGL